MHGLTGGGWKRKRRPRSPREGRPSRKLREYRPRDLPTITPPRLPPTLHGRYFKSALVPSLNRINDYLVRWIVQKYKRFRGRWMRARDALGRAAKLYPRLFAHWQFVKP
jgi:hypothetical protein